MFRSGRHPPVAATPFTGRLMLVVQAFYQRLVPGPALRAFVIDANARRRNSNF